MCHLEENQSINNTYIRSVISKWHVLFAVVNSSVTHSKTSESSITIQPCGFYDSLFGIVFHWEEALHHLQSGLHFCTYSDLHLWIRKLLILERRGSVSKRGWRYIKNVVNTSRPKLASFCPQKVVPCSNSCNTLFWKIFCENNLHWNLITNMI